MKKVFFNLLILAGMLSCWSCSDDDEDSPFQGTDNTLVSFTLTTTSGVKYQGAISDNQVLVTAPQNVSLAGAKVAYALCEQATISPDPAQVSDWDAEQQFTVTSYNKSSKAYTYKVVRTDVPTEGSVTLKTQADVVALAESGVAIINGDLVIGGNALEEEDPITDLSPLSGLNEVKQNIFVYNSFAGTDLKGLENIRSAAGLYLGSNSLALTTANALEVNLSSLKTLGTLAVNSQSIKSLSLPALKEVGYFYLCAQKVEDIDFTSLTDCATDFIMKQASTSTYNEVIEKIEFPALKNIGGLMTLYNYNASVFAFPKLEQIGAKVDIRYMQKWTDISFPELKVMNSEFSMQYMSAVKSLSMPKLQTVNGNFNFDLTYSGNVLTTVNLDALKNVEGDFKIRTYYESTYETLSLPLLERVKGQFYPYQTKQYNGAEISSLKTLSIPKLTDCKSIYLYGLNILEKLDLSTCTGMTSLDIISCYKLEELKCSRSLETFTLNAGSTEVPVLKLIGLEEVTKTLSLDNFSKNDVYSLGGIKKVGALTITGGNIKELSFPDVEEVASLRFQLYLLTSLKMDKLKTVTGDFYYSSMKDMTDDGFSFASLETIGGKLTIEGFYDAKQVVLTTLKGFDSLKEVGSVSISNMGNLVDFSALKTAADKLTTGWSVSGNAYNPTLDDMHAGNCVQE